MLRQKLVKGAFRQCLTGHSARVLVAERLHISILKGSCSGKVKKCSTYKYTV